MKTRSLTLIFILCSILISGCGVANVKTFIRTENCTSGKIIIATFVDNRNEYYINHLCQNLNQKLSSSGYDVYEYLPNKSNPEYFAKLIDSINPKYVLTILPENKFRTSSSGFIEVDYKMDLYNRTKFAEGKNIYSGIINIVSRMDNTEDVAD